MEETIQNIAYSPQDASRLSLEMVNDLRTNRHGVQTGIADMDRALIPARPGELITVLGYTSHYKSGFMNWISRQAIKDIEPGSNKIVVRVTWEQSVEEDTITWLAGATNIPVTNIARGLVDEKEWKLLNRAAVKRATTPMWIVGHSQQESAARRRARPRMTIHDVINAVEYIVNDATSHRLEIVLIVLDYLQRIRPAAADGDNKRQQQMEAVNGSKDMAISFACPVYLGVQTGRQVIDRANKTPQVNDGQETSNIEQSSDKMIGLWYPIKTEPKGAKINGIEVTENLLIATILKQKLGAAPITLALYVDPERNLIGSRADLPDQEKPKTKPKKEEATERELPWYSYDEK